MKAGENLDICFATTRFNQSRSKSNPLYTNERHLDLGRGSVEYGISTVKIPHGLTSMTQSSSWNQYRSRLRTNDLSWAASRIQSTRQLEYSDFWRQLSNKPGVICVFVHGYDESMQDSTRDTAAICSELMNRLNNKAVTPILFSWPSKDRTQEYTADEENMNWSKMPFRKFIEALAIKKSPDTKLYIIGHSLGSRLVFDLVNSSQLRLSKKIDKIVLSSSDFDFHQALQRKEDLENLVKENISILVSDRDGPLITSQLLHKSPRLGRPIDPPSLSGSTNTTSNLNKKSFWKGVLNEASNLLNPKPAFNSKESSNWVSSGKSRPVDFGDRSKFYDVSELVTADLGHRLAWPVISSLLANQSKLSPLGTTVVYKKPDRLLLMQSGGTPEFTYKFYRISKNKFGTN